MSETEGTTRLVVNLTSKAARALRRLAGRDGLNRTTIVNRAVIVYELLQQFQDDGKYLSYTDEHGQIVRLVLL